MLAYQIGLPLSCDSRWTDCSVDCCVNTVDENITTAKNLANFGPVTPEIICTGGESTRAKIGCALVFKDHLLGGSNIASL